MSEGDRNVTIALAAIPAAARLLWIPSAEKLYTFILSFFNIVFMQTQVARVEYLEFSCIKDAHIFIFNTVCLAKQYFSEHKVDTPTFLEMRFTPSIA